MRRHLDLFSGIGGFALAAHWAGYETIQFVEIDPFCQRVLKKHWPEVPIYDDIKTFDATGLQGHVDLVSGGFPCQPFSVAGKQAGNDDDRALWPEMRRVIAECRPRWVLAENVPGFINMALDDLLVDLEALGYETGALVVPAASVGAPHIRQRLWIVAHAASQRVGDAPVPAHPVTAGGEARQVPSGGGPGSGARDVPDAPDGGLRCGRAPGEAGQPAQPRQDVPDAVRDLRARDGHDPEPAVRPGAPATEAGGDSAPDQRRSAVGGLGVPVDGLPGWVAGPGTRPWDGDWEAGISRTTEHEPDRVAKLKALGNAIVPQVAYEIIRHLEDV